jgi:O-antigen/teichoic acid export membrane protein
VAVFCFSQGLTLVVGLLAAAAAYVLLNGPVSHPELFAPAMAHLGGYVLLKNVSWNMDTVFGAFRAARTLFWVRLHEAVANLAFAVAMTLVTKSVWGLVIAAVATMATSFVHRVIAIRHWLALHVTRPELREGFRTLPEIVRFGLKVTPGTIADGVSQESATWTLAMMGHVTALGAYSRAWLLSARFVQVSYRITEMLFPELVERRRRGDDAGFARALVDTMRYVGTALVLMAAAGGGAAPGIMALYGPGFERGAAALAILLLFPGAQTLSNIQTHALMALDRPATVTYVSLCRMVVTVGAVIPLTLAMGITGTAIGLLAGIVFDFAVRTAIVRHHLHQPFAKLWPLRQALAMAGAYACAFAAARTVDDALGHAAGLVVGLAVGVGVFAIVFVGVGGLSATDKARARRIRRRVLKPTRRPAQEL